MTNLLPDTDLLKKQHQYLLLFTNKVAMILESPDVNEKSGEIYSLLLKLADTLNAHLHHEDKTLYPYLIKNTNENMRTLGEKFFNDLGGLAEKFEVYRSRWPDATTIEERLVEFKQETEAVLKALINRIDRENNDLYPVIDHFIATRG